MTDRFTKETASLRVSLSYMAMYAGKAENAFNRGPLTIEHWRFGRQTSLESHKTKIELRDLEELRDLHFMIGRAISVLEGAK